MAWIWRDLVVAMLLGIIVMSGLLAFMVDVNLFYGINVDPSYNAIYADLNNTLLKTKDTASQIQTKVESSETLTASSTVAFIGDAAVDAVRTIFGILKIIPNLITIISLKVGLPEWFTTTILSIISFIIASIVLTLIFRRKA